MDNKINSEEFSNIQIALLKCNSLAKQRPWKGIEMKSGVL